MLSEHIKIDICANLALFLVGFMWGTEGTDPARGVQHGVNNATELRSHLLTLWTLAWALLSMKCVCMRLFYLVYLFVQQYKIRYRIGTLLALMTVKLVDSYHCFTSDTDDAKELKHTSHHMWPKALQMIVSESLLIHLYHHNSKSRCKWSGVATICRPLQLLPVWHHSCSC